MSLLHRIRRGLVVLAGVFAINICGRQLLIDESWLESLYITIVTVSTVGYGEQSSAEPAVQLLNIALIVVGTVAVGYTIGLIIQAMIAGQIDQALGVRRMTHEIEHLSGHTILCGYGRIGRILAIEFRQRGKPYVVVDSDSDVVANACEENELVVTGDATLEETLKEAGIERADTVVVALKNDAENVFLTLTARNLNPQLKIIARGEHVATEKKLLQAGADRVVLPAVIGAKRMAALVTRPHAAEMLEHFADHERIDAELEEITVVTGSELIGQSVRQAAARHRHNLLIVGIRRADGEMLFNPQPDEEFQPQDTLVVMGKRADIANFQQTYKL